MDTRLLEINDDSANLTPNPRYDLECPTKPILPSSSFSPAQSKTTRVTPRSSSSSDLRKIWAAKNQLIFLSFVIFQGK